MFRFYFSVSTQPYDRNKDEKRTGSLIWTETNGTIEDLKRFILNNYAFCNCFHHNAQTFTNSQKKRDNLRTANIVMLDLDAVKYDVEDFWKLMQETEITPNLVYTTKNNGHIKKKEDRYPNRYRCVYVLDKGIDNTALYESLVISIKNEIAEYCDDNSVFNDNTDKDCSHFFAGNDDAMCFVQHREYPLNFFIERYDLGSVQFPPLLYRERGKVIIDETGHPKEEKKFIDESFGIAWEKQKSNIRLLYDFERYNTYTTTQIDWKDGELFRFVDDSYVYNLERRWRITDDNYHTIVRYHYGEHRKRKIWSALLIRRLIKPSITLEELCFAAVYELYNYIDNTDSEHYITRKHLKHIAEEVLDCDIEAYRDRYRWKTKSGNNKTYIINRMERIKQGLSVTEVMQLAKAESKNRKYIELSRKYDADKSVRQNAEMLGVSKGTVLSLIKWLQEHKDIKVDNLSTQEETTQPEPRKYPQIEEENNMDMCCEDMIREIHMILKTVFEPQINTGKKDLSWLKKPMKHLAE